MLNIATIVMEIFRIERMKVTSVKNKILQGSVFPVILVLILSAISYATIRDLLTTIAWVEHTHEVIEKAIQVEKAIVDMETGERGFLKTGKDDFLEPYYAGKQKRVTLINDIKLLVSDNPPQVERIIEINDFISQWENEAATPELNARNDLNKGNRTQSEVGDLIESRVGKAIMDLLRIKLGEFISVERVLLEQRKLESAKLADSVIFYIQWATALFILLVIFSTFRLAKKITTPLKDLVNLSNKVKQGDYSARSEVTTTDEIGILAGTLNLTLDSVQYEVDKQVQLLENQKALLELSKEDLIDLYEGLNRVITVDAEQLQVARVSVWLLNDDNTAISCEALYNDGEISNEGITLESKDYPNYFKALDVTGFISADDAQTHPETNEFTNDYLIPLGITSMLDSPIRIHGKVVGIVCHEHVGASREWTLADEQFASAIADKCAQFYLEYERKQAEDQLQNVINAAQLGYWDWNYQTGQHVVNEHWLTMLGLSQSDIEHNVNDWNKLIHPDDKQHVVDIVQDHIHSGKSYVAEFRMKHADGHWVWIQGSGAVVEYDHHSHEALRLCGTHQDISERKKVEDELHDYKQDLESVVKTRTRDLNEALKEAEQANKAKSEFLSSMSHELRTPMNAVLGFSQLLESDTIHPLTEEQLESVSYISESGHHLLQLIDGVLDLSKIESEHLELSMGTVNLNKLFLEIVTLTKHDADKSSITVVNTVIDDLAFNVHADYSKLKQVLLNFTSNAIKYNSEQGSVILSCSQSDARTVRLSISDMGEGVEEGSLSALFEPFNRLKHENSAILGTGIGLTIAKKLTELMGGEIGVFNNPNKGATFWVEFKSE